MYQNKTKILVRQIVYSLFFVPCAFITFIMVFDVILVVTNQIQTNEDDLPLTSVITAAFLILTIFLFRKARNAFRARKVNRYFEMDEDGLIEIEEIAKHMKMKQRKFVAFFIDCVGKGLLKNCMVFPEDPTYILLDNGKNTIAEKYVVLHCKGCGAPNTFRIGYETTCKYCGAVVLKKNHIG